MNAYAYLPLAEASERLRTKAMAPVEYLQALLQPRRGSRGLTPARPRGSLRAVASISPRQGGLL